MIMYRVYAGNCVNNQRLKRYCPHLSAFSNSTTAFSLDMQNLTYHHTYLSIAKYKAPTRVRTDHFNNI